MKILVVEDEGPLAQTISRILTESGWRVDCADDGEKGYLKARSGEYELLILDILLPGRDGWSICAELRGAKVNVPILMLTAMDDVADKVKGLNLGADDYLSKPFEATELIARVNALLRRDKANKGETILIDDLHLDTTTMRVTRGGKEIDLTRREYDLLLALALNEGRVLSRETIQDRAWNDDDVFSNTVEVYISSLRKKIDHGSSRKLIHTAHGFGYVIRLDS